MRGIKLSISLLAFVVGSAVSWTSHATTYTFCANWAYYFDDAGIGEDYLLHADWWGGKLPAAHTVASVKRNGQNVWTGYLNASGCTSAVTGSSGQYEFLVGSTIDKGIGHPVIELYTEDDVQVSFSWTASLPTASVPSTQTADVGFLHPVGSVAAAVLRALARSDTGFVANETYKIRTMQNCPNPPGDACAGTSGVWLGWDVLHQYWLAHNKSTVAHELGHHIQGKLMGGLPGDKSYSGMPTSIPLCRCEHVDTGSQTHCIQSRHNVSDTQTEGWGHFFAVDLFNNPSHSNASFGYYKEFKDPFYQQVWPPPVAFNTYDPIKWMDALCPLANRGVELDWLGFYWWAHNKGTSSVRYSFSNLKTVYQASQACNGSCSLKTVTWSSLVAAVNAQSFTTAKKQHWTLTTGPNYGVNF